MELLVTGKPVQELAEELRISASLLYNWRAGSQEPQLLRREHARLQVENDILKKAAVILGTRAQAGSAK